MTELTKLAISVDATGMKQGEQALDSIANKAEQAERRTNSALKKVGNGIDRAGSSAKKAIAPLNELGGKAIPQATDAANRLGPAFQNASYQIGDFAVQVAGGQSAAIAFAQQFPQLAGGLGLWGAALGAAVAVGAAVAPMLVDLGNEARTYEDALEDLKAAQDRVTASIELARMPIWQLIETYGSGAERVREMALAQLQLNVAVARGTLSDAVLSLADATKKYTDIASMWYTTAAKGFDAIKEDFGLAGQDAVEFVLKLKAVNEATTSAIQTERFQELVDWLRDAGIELKDMPPEMAKAAAAMLDVNIKTEELEKLIEDASSAATELSSIDVASGIHAAAGAAAMLAGNLQTAVDLKWQLASSQYSGAGYGPDLERFGNPYEGDGAQAPTTSQRPKAAPMGTGGVDWGAPPAARKSRSGSGKTKTNSYEKDVFTIQKETEALLAQADAVAKIVAAGGDWEHALRVVEEEQQLLIEAQRAGVALTPEIKASIRSWAEEYVAAEENLEGLKDRITDFAEMQREVGAAFKSGFSEWISGAKSLQDALAGVISRLADMAASRAFDLLWDGGGKKGGGGGILGSFVSSIFGGFKATGGPVSSGKGYIVGENGPEWFEPGQNGTIVPNHALGGSVGGNAAPVFHIDARGAQEGVAEQIVRAIQQATPSIVSQSVLATQAAQKRGHR